MNQQTQNRNSMCTTCKNIQVYSTVSPSDSSDTGSSDSDSDIEGTENTTVAK